MNTQSPFKWRHFQADIRMMCVRWYLRYPLSYRDLEEMTRERGLRIDHTTIYRWVQHSAPELEKRCRSHQKACNDFWKVDETYIKVKKVWMYHSRSVDSEGNTLEFLLSATRDAEAAKHIFIKALGASARSVPQATTIEKKTTQPPAPTAFKARNAAPHVINVDKNAAYSKAIVELKASGILPALVVLRQVKYLNNLIEQDHRFIKRLVKPGMGSFSFDTAWKTLQGYKSMHMIREGQVQGVNKGETPSQAAFIAELFGVAIYTPQDVRLHTHQSPPGFLQHNRHTDMPGS